MSITDELRKWVRDGKGSLLAIADRIDAAHEEALVSSYFDGVFSDEELAENGFIRLPKDADGEPIRIWDVMDSDHYEDGTVVGLQFFNTANKTPRVLIAIRPHGWDTPTWHDPESYRHHKPPTVEDVLTEFGIDWEHEDNCEDRAALLAEYAKRLKLAGEGE